MTNSFHLTWFPCLFIYLFIYSIHQDKYNLIGYSKLLGLTVLKNKYKIKKEIKKKFKQNLEKKKERKKCTVKNFKINSIASALGNCNLPQNQLLQ